MIGPRNGREARESGLWLEGSVTPYLKLLSSAAEPGAPSNVSVSLSIASLKWRLGQAQLERARPPPCAYQRSFRDLYLEMFHSFETI